MADTSYNSYTGFIVHAERYPISIPIIRKKKMKPHFIVFGIFSITIGIWFITGCVPTTPIQPSIMQEPIATIDDETPYPVSPTNTTQPTFIQTNTNVLPYIPPSTSTPSSTPNWIPPLNSTPKPITYSITSTENWFVYQNEAFNFSFKYPERPPNDLGPQKETLTFIDLFIRTGPTVPRSPANIAGFFVDVQANDPELDDVSEIAKIMGQYSATPETSEPISMQGLQALQTTNAEKAMVYRELNGHLRFFVAVYGDYFFIMGETLMTDWNSQELMYPLWLSTFQFGNP